MTRFKTPNLQQMYRICRELAADHASEFWYAGRPRRGAGHRAAYWNGRSGLRSSYPVYSLAHAAWAAGQDDLREHGSVVGSKWRER